METFLSIALIVLGYLCGSIASAIIICKLWKLPDPRTVGSQNPGATNVLRLGSKSAALFTLVSDILKGAIPVLLAKILHLPPLVISLVALAACLGHIFPVFFHFKGGKGVATSFGAVLALSWPVALAALGTWLIIAAIFRYSSLAAIVSSLMLPIFTYLLANKFYVIPMTVLALIIVGKHKANILRLVQGQESKIGKK